MSHRSYRPVQPCGNKLLQKQWDQRYYDEHRRLVSMACRTAVDNLSTRLFTLISGAQCKADGGHQASCEAPALDLQAKEATGEARNTRTPLSVCTCPFSGAF